MGHAGDANEFLEIFGEELRTVVGDDARRDAGMTFASALENGFDVGFLHFFADFPVNDEAAAAVEEGAKKVKRPCDIEVTDVDMPVFVRLEWLDEAGTFFGGNRRRAGQESGGFENAVDAGGAASDDVGIEHHEGEPAIAFEGMGAGEVLDLGLFDVGEPVIAWHPGVVFVDFAVALPPIVEFARTDADPREEATDGDFRLVAPGSNEIDERVTGVVRHPLAGQGSPRLFLSETCSSMSSASTESLR